MRYVIALALCAAGAALAVAAQTPAVAAFEVASIKVNASGDGNFGFTPQPGGVLLATNVTTRQMVRYAYSMQNSRVEGGPEWLDTDRYDITAKAAAPATQDQMLAMLRTLLTDRFGLVMHIEARDTPIFALVRARTDGRLGPRLRPSSVDCTAARSAIARGASSPAGDGRPVCAGRARPGFIIAGAVTMDEVARNISRLAGRVVVNRTGLEGGYDFDLTFAPEGELTAAPAERAPAALPTLFVALEEQLGLKLEPQRAPVAGVVIDSVRRPVED